MAKTPKLSSKSNATSPTVAPPAPKGNRFIYLTPKQGQPTVKPPKTDKSNGDDQANADAGPMKFIEDSFERTKVELFSSKTPPPNLVEYRKIEKQEVIRAALECGYGPKDWWTSKLAMEPEEVLGLHKFLLARLETAISCVERDDNETWRIRPFYKQIEGSDKSPVSFTLGGIGSFFAAENWLGKDDEMVSFLHKSIYGKALVKVTATSSKSPDYLVEAQSECWHLFESKGGGIGQRGNRLIQGLEQLDGDFQVGWKRGPIGAPKSCVCVHTRVDPKMSLDVMAVDPPNENVSEAGGAQHSFVLIESVCKLLLVLRTIDQFRCLTDAIEKAGPEGQWTYKRADNFGGLIVGIPNVYLNHELELRSRMALYPRRYTQFLALARSRNFPIVFAAT